VETQQDSRALRCRGRPRVSIPERKCPEPDNLPNRNPSLRYRQPPHDDLVAKAMQCFGASRDSEASPPGRCFASKSHDFQPALFANRRLAGDG
jgi:hypothetical protein